MEDHELIDEFHIRFHIPDDLPEPECDDVLRVLNSRRFRRHLLKAVRRVCRRRQSLREVKVELTR